MKLYEYWRSSCSYRLRIALNLKGIPYDSEHVHLLKGEQRQPQFLEVNPMGTVPVLQDGDVLVAQSLAAMEYLEEVHLSTPLLPDYASDRAYVRSLCLAIISGMQPLGNISVLQYLETQFRISPEQKQRWLEHWMEQGFAALEKMVSRHGAYCFYNQVTLADVCLVPQLYVARRFNVALEAYPTLQAIETHCLALPAFQQAHPDQHPCADR